MPHGRKVELSKEMGEWVEQVQRSSLSLIWKQGILFSAYVRHRWAMATGSEEVVGWRAEKVWFFRGIIPVTPDSIILSRAFARLFRSCICLLQYFLKVIYGLDGTTLIVILHPCLHQLEMIGSSAMVESDFMTRILIAGGLPPQPIRITINHGVITIMRCGSPSVIAVTVEESGFSWEAPG